MTTIGPGVKNVANMTHVVYVGSRPSAAYEHGTRRYTFVNGKALWVPSQFATKLLAMRESFVLAEDLRRTLEDLEIPGLVVMRRWGALGDLIMFRAACSAFLRQNPAWRFVIRCQERFAYLFAHDKLWVGHWPIGVDRTADLDKVPIRMFDQVAEADHRGDSRHRVELFMAALTKMAIEIKPEDWDIPVSPEAVTYVRKWLDSRGLAPGTRSRPLLGIQVRGSGKMKTLPDKVVKDVLRRLTAFAEVVLIEPAADVAAQFEDDSVHSMPNRDALHAIELMRHCDLAITMDSGALWLAHCARVPLLAILGPTRPAQRISMHTARAEAVCLNELIDCPACFEAAAACKGTFRCMQDQPDWRRVVRAIVGRAESMLTGDVALPLV